MFKTTNYLPILFSWLCGIANHNFLHKYINATTNKSNVTPLKISKIEKVFDGKTTIMYGEKQWWKVL